MPYEVGEYVIYSSLGICQVIQNDAHVSLAGDENELYYILAPIEKRLGKAYVPHSRSAELRHTLNKKRHYVRLTWFSTLSRIPFRTPIPIWFKNTSAS